MSSLIPQDFFTQIATPFDGILERLHAQPALTSTLAAGALSVTIVPWLISNYQKFKELGRHPTPIRGWLIALVYKLFEQETTSTQEYVRDMNKDSWLKGGEGKNEIPYRKRPRPRTGWHSLPHRQMDQCTESKKLQEVSNHLIINVLYTHVLHASYS